MREEFVKRVLLHEKSKSALCREYGISRPTGDKWVIRYLAGGKCKRLGVHPKAVSTKRIRKLERRLLHTENAIWRSVQ